MKVNIGPYIHRWVTTHFERWCLEKLHKKDWWEIEDEELTKLDGYIEQICDWWQAVLNATINQYIDRKERKISVKIDPYDTWSADHTLALIILPILKQLAEDKHGSPLVDDEDVPEELQSHNAPPVNEWESDDLLHDRWEWVMNEMIWSFEQLVDDDNDDQFHQGEIDIDWAPVDVHGDDVPEEDAKFFEMRKGPNDTHTYDKEGHTAHMERIDRGLRLFGKYFRGLWD